MSLWMRRKDEQLREASGGEKVVFALLLNGR